ncbi:TIGR03364 family FAD-dependent oxidoreductase [Ochrovirga pacifica]|uniref:TIGR03364 family FAD-dependent oxidoreductase n=1 Tax=Ochrovirga pacifica TaxID=1042376 RepID=UPI0002557BD9|nr:TIGR03364 family FAD-dependent oxidoreductase [Ochrovirga pacifica]
MNHKKYDLIIVGGGILGTFHAYHALKKGLKVVLLEKNTVPQGATVRNFGQIVPSGMDLKWQNIGRKSLEIYQEISQLTDITIRQSGSIYIASDTEELQLIEELSQINKSNNYESHLLTQAQSIACCAGLKKEYAKGALFFPQEMNVDPSLMIHRVRKLLIEKYQLEFFSNNTVKDLEDKGNEVLATTANNQKFIASKAIVCNGSDFKILFPELFNQSDLVVSKLQMLRTKPQKNYTLAPSVLTGWTIRRYESFYECPSFQSIKDKENKEAYHNQYGVHILFKQVNDGSVILGDSHEYQDAVKADLIGFDRNEDLDHFMIEESKKIMNLPNYQIDKRWVGMYSQCKEQDVFEQQIEKNIHIVTGIGGKGMTGSPAFSEMSLNNIINR